MFYINHTIFSFLKNNDHLKNNNDTYLDMGD